MSVDVKSLGIYQNQINIDNISKSIINNQKIEKKILHISYNITK